MAASRRRAVLAIVSSVVAYGVALMVTVAHPAAKDGLPNAGQFLLTGTKVPDPGNLSAYVADRSAAIVLGKALFWDTQAGSDGVQACASCHFDSGTDNRIKNEVNPAHNGLFNMTGSGVKSGPNGTASAGDFPTHRLSDPNNRTSTIRFDTDDVHGSQGVFLRTFITSGALAQDACSDQSDATYNVGGVNVRRVTGRQAPTAINAAFNFRNFWDGRAREQFNGANPSGSADPSARVYQTQADGSIAPVAILIDNASAASQATGPALSGTEMSCGGRSWPDVGRKLLLLTPLGQQHVDPTDSVLGAYVNTNGIGLTSSYAALIQQAFQPAWWNGTGTVSINGNSFGQMEANFSLFWGLAIQMYESTLVSDDTPVDRFALGNTSALSADAQAGLALFTGNAQCVACHKNGLLTDAVGTILNPPGGHAFVNTGVRAVAEDGGDVLVPNQGRFKTPTLRNVEFTGPYFHNGGQATLRQVVDFYNRGGDFPGSFTDSQIRSLNLTSTQKDQIVSFLLALSDDRVRWSRAPFDHPELCVPNGQQGDSQSVAVDASGRAQDTMTCMPANGAAGAATPLTTYLGLDPRTP